MLEIPGEEAPTDPGLLARKRQEAEERMAAKRARTRSRVIGAVVLLLAAVGGGFAWNRYQKQQEELVYELGDVYMAPAAVRAAPAVVEPTPDQPEKLAVRGSGGRKRPELPDASGDVPTAPDKPAGTGGAGGVKYVPGSSQGGDMTVGTMGGASSASSVGTAEIAVKRVNTTVLESDDEILAMAKEVTAAYQPQIQTCVEQRLKVDETFSGGWRVAFTIQTDGSVGSITTDALDKPDGDLEACLQRAISRWHYQRIIHEFKVKKSYRFTARQ